MNPAYQEALCHLELLSSLGFRTDDVGVGVFPSAAMPRKLTLTMVLSRPEKMIAIEIAPLETTPKELCQDWPEALMRWEAETRAVKEAACAKSRAWRKSNEIVSLITKAGIRCPS